MIRAHTFSAGLVSVIALCASSPAEAVSNDSKSSQAAEFQALLGSYLNRQPVRGDDSDDSNDIPKTAFDDSDDRYVALVGPGFDDSDDSDDSDDNVFDDSNDRVDDGTGLLSIKTNEFGYYTGKLTLGGRNYPLKRGRFSGGQHTQTVGEGVYRTKVTLRLSGNGDISGTVSALNDTFSSPLAGGLNSKGGLPVTAGKYTVLIPGDETPDSGLPKGDGYAVMTVTKRGDARIVGSLADGSKFSVGTLVTDQGKMPFYQGLYNKRGFAAGFITFEENPGVSDAHGALRIYKPFGLSKQKRFADGFFYKAPFAASTYKMRKPILNELNAAGEATFVLGEGNLPADLEQSVTISRKNKLSLLNQQVVQINAKIKTKNGLFSGKLQLPGQPQSTVFKGVFFQQQATAGGFFLNDSESGFIRLSPAE